MDLIDFPALERVLQDFAKDFEENYKDTLRQHGRVASGDLINSVKTKVNTGTGYYEVTVTLKDYWKYVENGTRPHWPPRDAILRWIQIKHITPYQDSRGRLPSPESLAFLISRAMAGQSPNQPYPPPHPNPMGGTAGSHDMQSVKDALIPLFRQRIAEALGNDMQAYFRRVTVF